MGIALDSSGNVYVTGETHSADFPMVGAVIPTKPDQFFSAFVAKLNSTGSALVYSTYLGGSRNDEGLAIAVDATGSAYVTGETDSIDFPVASAFQTACPFVLFNCVCAGAAFVTKLNPAGSADYQHFGIG